MFVPDDAGQRIHDDFAVDEHGDTITCPRKGVQIVSHHHHRQAERAAQVKDQVVEGGGGDRIEARGGFIEKQQRRIERERARQRRALDHAARQLRRKLCAGLDRQADHPQPQLGEALQRGFIELEQLDHRQDHVLASR